MLPGRSLSKDQKQETHLIMTKHQNPKTLQLSGTGTTNPMNLHSEQPQGPRNPTETAELGHSSPKTLNSEASDRQAFKASRIAARFWQLLSVSTWPLPSALRSRLSARAKGSKALELRKASEFFGFDATKERT